MRLHPQASLKDQELNVRFIQSSCEGLRIQRNMEFTRVLKLISMHNMSAMVLDY